MRQAVPGMHVAMQCSSSMLPQHIPTLISANVAYFCRKMSSHRRQRSHPSSLATSPCQPPPPRRPGRQHHAGAHCLLHVDPPVDIEGACFVTFSAHRWQASTPRLCMKVHHGFGAGFCAVIYAQPPHAGQGGTMASAAAFVQSSCHAKLIQAWPCAGIHRYTAR